MVDLVIYKKIVEGDLRKFTATANDANNGGGARDLRFSPAIEFYPAFQRMFDQQGTRLMGYFNWINQNSPFRTRVEIHPPTNSRSNEVRIGKIHECFPQTVIPNNADDCILLIVLDDNHEVWPYFTSEYELTHGNWHPAIRDPIIAGLHARRRAGTTAMGIVDVTNGRSYTNDH